MTRDITRDFYEKYPYPNVERFTTQRMQNYANPLLAAANLTLNDLNGKTVFDVGCGTGEITCSIATHARSTKGIDFSTRSIAQAKATAQKFKLKNVTFEVADLFSYDPTQTFDTVTSFGVLHHTPHFEKGLARISKWVKSNGWLIVGFYHPWGGMEQRMQKWLASIFAGHSAEEKIEWVEKKQKAVLNEHAQAFWADRIANPRESYHRVGEVKRLFEQNGFEVMGVQSHKPTWKVKKVNDLTDVLKFELEILMRRKRFVIMAGKRST